MGVGGVGAGGRSTKNIYSREGKFSLPRSLFPFFFHARQLILKKYSCYGLKKIHRRNLITKKNSCGSKIFSSPHPAPPPLPLPAKFPTGPSLRIHYWKTLPGKSQLIHWLSQKSRASSRHLFPAALLVKSCTLLTSSSIKQPLGVLLWLSQVEISLLNEQASKKLTRLVTATKY